MGPFVAAWWALGLASGASVEAMVEVTPGGLTLVDARIVEGDTLSRPGAIKVQGADGQELGSAALPDFRLRSVIHDHGAEGEVTSVERAAGLVRLPWPAGAAAVELGGQRLTPKASGGLRLDRPLPPPSSVEALLESGPSGERLDLIILGDGYRSQDQGRFHDDAEGVADYLLAMEPYSSYEGLFNIWVVEVVSDTAGAGRDGIPKDTALGCYYGCGGIDRLLCCDDGAVMGTVADTVPDADGVLVLVNDAKYGGAGGFNYATAYNGPDGTTAVQVAAHEIGHSLVGLWDEYSYGSSGGGQGGSNCAPNKNNLPWESWVGDEGIDAFKVCSYTDLFRPTDTDCIMNSLQDDYCAVCREQVVLEMYRRVPDMLVGLTPEPGTPLTVESGGEAIAFDYELVGPDNGGLDFVWKVGDEVVSQDPSFVLDSCGNLDGELTLVVTDNTHFVRDDPEGLTSRTYGPWTVKTAADEDCASGLEDLFAACGCATGGGTGAILPSWAALGLLLARRRRT